MDLLSHKASVKACTSICYSPGLLFPFNHSYWSTELSSTQLRSFAYVTILYICLIEQSYWANAMLRCLLTSTCCHILSDRIIILFFSMAFRKLIENSLSCLQLWKFVMLQTTWWPDTSCDVCDTPPVSIATPIVYIYSLKMQLAVCFKHLPVSVGTQTSSLNVHPVRK